MDKDIKVNSDGIEMKENHFLDEGRYKGLIDDIDAIESYCRLFNLI